MEKLEPWCIAGGTVKWCGCCGNQFGEHSYKLCNSKKKFWLQFPQEHSLWSWHGLCLVSAWCDCFFWQVLHKTDLTLYFLLILKYLVPGKDVKSVTNRTVGIVVFWKWLALKWKTNKTCLYKWLQARRYTEPYFIFIRSSVILSTYYSLCSVLNGFI